MNQATKWTLTIFLILLACLGIYGGLYAYSASKIEIRNVQIQNLEEISTEGFVLNGNVEVYNGGLVSVGVDSIAVQLLLEHNDLQLANAVIQGGNIPPKKTKSYDFRMEVNWRPTIELAVRLLTPEGTFASLQGTVFLEETMFGTVEIEFEERIDLELYIKQFASDKIQGVVDTVVQGIQNFFN